MIIYYVNWIEIIFCLIMCYIECRPNAHERLFDCNPSDAACQYNGNLHFSHINLIDC